MQVSLIHERMVVCKSVRNMYPVASAHDSIHLLEQSVRDIDEISREVGHHIQTEMVPCRSFLSADIPVIKSFCLRVGNKSLLGFFFLC